MFGSSSELAIVMEFGFYRHDVIVKVTIYLALAWWSAPL